MPTTCSIVDIESQDQLDNRGQILGMIDLAGSSGRFHPFAQLARGTGSPCDGKPGRCLVGEQQGHVQERRQRQQPPRGPFEPNQGQERSDRTAGSGPCFNVIGAV